jgi:hypothetical protein
VIFERECISLPRLILFAQNVPSFMHLQGTIENLEGTVNMSNVTLLGVACLDDTENVWSPTIPVFALQ